MKAEKNLQTRPFSMEPYHNSSTDWKLYLF